MNKKQIKRSKRSKQTWKKILIVKIGSDERPAGPDDITYMEDRLKSVSSLKDYEIIVTHHACNFDFIKLP